MYSVTVASGVCWQMLPLASYIAAWPPSHINVHVYAHHTCSTCYKRELPKGMLSFTEDLYIASIIHIYIHVVHPTQYL